MFGRKKQAYTHYPTHTPPPPLPPRSRPAAPEASAEPLPRRCPLTQSACRDTCAWMVERECAATYLAREMYTLVEVMARGGGALPVEQQADGGLPSGAVVLPQTK